jgi:hypothetical protein
MATMKYFLAILLAFSLHFAYAQQCNQHALMRQGTRLEYLISSPSFKKEPTETRLSLTVSRVVDSAGGSYSEIIKEGASEKVEKDRYRRQFTIECDGKNIMIPFDFYNPDTIFVSQVMGGNRSRGVLSATEPLRDNFFSYIIPLALEGISSLPESDVKVIKQNVTVRPLGGGKSTMTYYWKMLNVTVTGKEKISTAAGTFDCFKVLAKCTVEVGRDFPVTLIMYISNEVGLVRSRTQSEFPGAETELVKVKK